MPASTPTPTSTAYVIKDSVLKHMRADSIASETAQGGVNNTIVMRVEVDGEELRAFASLNGGAKPITIEMLKHNGVHTAESFDTELNIPVKVKVLSDGTVEVLGPEKKSDADTLTSIFA